MKYCCGRRRPDHMTKPKAAVSPEQTGFLFLWLLSDGSSAFRARSAAGPARRASSTTSPSEAPAPR